MHTDSGENNSSPSKKIVWAKRVWSILPVSLLIVIVIALMVAISIKQEKIEAAKQSSFGKGDQSANVVTLTLYPKTISERINLPGVVEPWIKLNVVAEVSGAVVKKSVKDGQEVKKGDVIAEIDPDRYQNLYQSAKASYQSAVTSKERLEELYKEQLTKKSDLDSISAQAENYQAAMKNAAIDVERCTITSPIDGTVNHIFIENGEYLNVTTKVAEIVQIRQVKVRVGIPESDVNAVRQVENYEVQIDALGGKKFPAKKYFLSQTSGENARLYTLDLVVDNPDAEILPDMFTRVDIVKKVRQNAMVVPTYSVISLNNGHTVYTEKEGVAHVRNVELGLQEGLNIEITKGLEENDNLIVVGHRSISDAQKVNVVRTVKNLEDII